MFKSRMLPVFVIVVVAGIAYLGWRQTVPGPATALSPAPKAVGGQTSFSLALRAARGRVVSAEVRLVQGQTAAAAAQSKLPPAGTGEQTVPVTVDARALKLQEGPATLEVYARDDFWRPFGQSGKPALSVPVTVDLTPPLLEVLSATQYLAQGGGGIVVLRSPDAVRMGTKVGGFLQPAFSAGPEGSGTAVAMVVLPWDLDPADGSVTAFAQDEAGNTAWRPVPSEIKPRKFPHDTIEISEKLLKVKIPELLPRAAGLSGDDLLNAFLTVNRDQRREAEEAKRRIGVNTNPKPLWDGGFSQAANTQVFANFAETRTYKYQGKVVDTQVHLGYDLASLKQAPVLAANAGVVAFTGPLTIYGNTVILDHGLGLQTLYAHLSTISVKPGDAVQKGQELGRSGSTGLAMGDHLHYEVMLHGTSVTPLEWWDSKWIRDHIYEPLGAAGLTLFASQPVRAEPQPQQASSPSRPARQRKKSKH